MELISDDILFKLGRPLPAAQLPTKGLVDLFTVNETNRISLQRVDHTQLQPDQPYDILFTEVYDAVSELGFYPPTSVFLFFSFPDALRDGFRQMVDLCRGMTSSSIVDLDSSIQAATGVSLLHSSSIRRVLLFLAVRCNQIPSRKTPQLGANTATLAQMGTPSDEHGTRTLCQYIDEPGSGADFLYPQAEAALIQNGWRRPSTRCTFWSLCEWKEEDFVRDGDLERGTAILLKTMAAKDFFHVPQADKDYLELPEPAKRTISLASTLAGNGCLRVLKQFLGPDGIIPAATLPTSARAQVLIGSISAEYSFRISSNRNPDRYHNLAYLLDSVEDGGIGLDPNVPAKSAVGGFRGTSFAQTALHIAMHINDTQAVDMLLKRGARTGIKDEIGPLPDA